MFPLSVALDWEMRQGGRIFLSFCCLELEWDQDLRQKKVWKFLQRGWVVTLPLPQCIEAWGEIGRGMELNTGQEPWEYPHGAADESDLCGHWSVRILFMNLLSVVVPLLLAVHLAVGVGVHTRVEILWSEWKQTN